LAKKRLDILLVEQELCTSRQIAQRLIRAGEVRVNQQLVDQPATEVDIEAVIAIRARSPFVSRGGEKLAKALAVFPVVVSDRICLDGGISTGGFTDCLLQAGAKLVYGIDVGYGQVDWGLRNDPRVILKERTNLRHLIPEELYPPEVIANQQLPTLGVVDVSFISLTKILPALQRLLQAPQELILLVKPQFEVGRDRVGKKGLVKDPVAQAEAIWQVILTAQGMGWSYVGLNASPIRGEKSGNIEYLLWLKVKNEDEAPLNQDEPAITLAIIKGLTRQEIESS
jgi:23S rRNA (cytidine1920-2'-O)/16S rRNA (cytidine1409-2'-O)-methyltransferase